MSISPAQCRAARALLGWSQDDLSTRSRIAKKSIADYERGVRNPQERTITAVQATLEASGVEFIPQNGGGDGVRFRMAMPRFLFRRDRVEHRQWIAFAFDYKSQRYIGFIDYNALLALSPEARDPVDIFDLHQDRILFHAAQRVDSGDLDPDGRVLIKAGDMPRIEFGSDGAG